MEDMHSRDIKKKILWIGAGILGIVVVYLIISAFVFKKLGPEYPFIIGAGLVIFWFLQEVLGPILAKDFEGKTREQMTAYKMYAGLGLIGYCGLIYFASSAGTTTGFYGAVVYAVSVMIKRRFLDDYRGVNEEGEEASDEMYQAQELIEQTGEEAGEKTGSEDAGDRPQAAADGEVTETADEAEQRASGGSISERVSRMFSAVDESDGADGADDDAADQPQSAAENGREE